MSTTEVKDKKAPSQIALKLWEVEHKLFDRATNLQNKGNYLIWRKALLLKKASKDKLIQEGNNNRLESYLAFRSKYLGQKFGLKFMKKSRSADSLSMNAQEAESKVSNIHMAHGHRRTPSMGGTITNTRPLTPSLPTYHRSSSSETRLSMSAPLKLPSPRDSPDGSPELGSPRARMKARGRGRGRGRNNKLNESADSILLNNTNDSPEITRARSSSTSKYEDAASAEKRDEEKREIESQELKPKIRSSSDPDIPQSSKPQPPPPPTTTTAPTTTTNNSLSPATTPRDNEKTSPRAHVPTGSYEFAGMHHVFLEHNRAVNTIKFAQGEKYLLAFSSYDGNISVCTTQPPKLLRSLQGHTEMVTDFCWAQNNEVIYSSSADKTTRVWAVRNGECLKIIKDQAPITSLSVHSKEHSLFVTGNIKGVVRSLNATTGREIDSVKFGNPISALEFTTSGEYFFVGDKKVTKNKQLVVTTIQGVVYTLQFTNGFLKALARVNVSQKAINSLTFKPPIKGKHPMRLLASCCDNTMKLMKVEAKILPTGNLTLEKVMPIPNLKEQVRSQFCPLIGSDGVALVSGSENGSVYIYDPLRDTPVCINQLQGHSGIVYDISWNSDESLLATCDATGMVILWKRFKHMTLDDIK